MITDTQYKEYAAYNKYRSLLKAIEEVQAISYITTNSNKGSKFHNLRRSIKRIILTTHGDEFLTLIGANKESKYCFEIIKATYDENVLFTVRVASDGVHHNHKVGAHFHEVNVTREMIHNLFEKEIASYVFVRKYAIKNKINELHKELMSLEFQLNNIETETY